MKPIFVHPEARAEIRKSLIWYLEQSESVAFGFSAEVQNAFLAISKNPQLYPKYWHGIQRNVLDRYPFSVIYIDNPDTIQIVAVAHAKRRPGYWQKRL